MQSREVSGRFLRSDSYVTWCWVFQVSLVGLTALLALLHHSHFYQEMLVVFTNFYAQPTIQHVSATDLMMSSQLSSASSESTMSTTGEQTQCTGTF